MGEAIGASLGYAVGIAISPVPVAAVILMLFSARAKVNGPAFMVAWLVGIATVATIVMLIPGLDADDGDPSAAAGWVKLGLGVLLLLVGGRQWRSRPGPDEEPQAPAWMDRIDAMQPPAAFGLGFLLSALNPKNLLLAAAAGATIGSLGLAAGEAVASMAVFTVIAALTVAVPVLAFLVAADAMTPRLDTLKDWLIANNATVMAVLFAVIGFNLVGDGIQILASWR